MHRKLARIGELALLGLATIATLVACVAVGCGNTPSPVNNQASPRATINVSPASGLLQVGGVLQFTTVTSGANQAVTWSVSGAGCTGAGCGTIDATGKYTAPATVPNPPTVTIAATLVADSTMTVTATVTVVVTLSPTFSVNPPTLDFGNQPIKTTSAPKSVTLTNTGTVAQPVSARMNGMNFADFQQTSDCPSIIAAGASCTYSVTFTPSVMGGRIGILVIDGTAEEEGFVQLTGTGTQ